MERGCLMLNSKGLPDNPYLVANQENFSYWSAFKPLTGKPAGKRPLGRPRRR